MNTYCNKTGSRAKFAQRSQNPDLQEGQLSINEKKTCTYFDAANDASARMSKRDLYP